MMRTILTCTILTVGLGQLGGCTSDGEHHEWLISGERAAAAGNYEQAVSDLSRFIYAEPQSLDVGRAYYSRGLAFAKSARRKLAYTDFKEALRKSPDGGVRCNACVALGTLYYEDEMWKAAAEAYGAAAARMAPTPPLDYVLWRFGESLERSGQWSRTRAPYERLVRMFPGSRLAEPARRRLALDASHFAIQCGVFNNASSADNLVRQLERQGLPAHRRREPRGGVMSNVVLVGRYATYDEAWRQLGVVRKYVPTAQIWP